MTSLKLKSFARSLILVLFFTISYQALAQPFVMASMSTRIALVGPLEVPQASDATSMVQSAIDAGGEVVLSCGVWNVTGLTTPSTGLALRGQSQGCVELHISSSMTAISCNGVASQFSIRDLIITGTAPSFNGGINIEDLGQRAIHVVDCPNVEVDNVKASRISGTAFECEHPSSGFNIVSSIRFSRVNASNSYRGFWIRNSCEYSIFSNVIARNNVFGAVVTAGNVVVDTFQFSYNYTNIQVVGQESSNPCHGTFSNGMSNHGIAYNLDVLSCALGHDFSNVRFIGDGSGSLASGGIIRISNSRGINIIGGEMGSNIAIYRADVITGATATAGTNKLEGTFVRNDIPGFLNPVVNYPGGLLMKVNFDASGSWSQNN